MPAPESLSRSAVEVRREAWPDSFCIIRPHAWLRPYYAHLRNDPTDARLALAFQFGALCDLVAVEHPGRATIRKSPTRRRERPVGDA